MGSFNTTYRKWKKVYICNYCHKVIRGGGINRIKKHLVGQKGEAKDKDVEFGCSAIMSDDDEEEQEITHFQNGIRKATSTSHPFLLKMQKGISFIKSVDASDIENNATNLCNLFAEIAEMVGAKNVVQMVTDNAANYKVAAYWLNPSFQYDRENFCKKLEVFRGVLDMVEKYFPGDEIFEVTRLLGIYRDGECEFIRTSAVKGRSQHHP
ncbi:hypothetical protein Tco_1304993, partial [Tanacetum coccineum]